MNILPKINSPEDVKRLDEAQLDELCAELREFLLEDVSRTGGHLASNLGAVELTVAMHRVYDTAKDRIVFDVGHQSYVHKLLTGRKDRFDTLRQLGGISGFPKPEESVHDAFIAGHASNSVSVALGMARARTMLGEDYDVAAFIGDGALSGGLAFEALNDAATSGEPLVIILNDNGMSITKNVGGLAGYLAGQRLKPSYFRLKERCKKALGHIPGGGAIYRFMHRVKNRVKRMLLPYSFFEDLGFRYIGPVDGHDVTAMCYYLEYARSMRVPVVVHAVTKKGKGYDFSERRPEDYHGVGRFDIENGLSGPHGTDYSACFGKALCAMAEKEPRICAITAAMTAGTGLTEFAKRFPKRFWDVGIAEGHAAAMAGGMAARGLIPVFAVYSTFLQRSYDMLIHDIALMGLHVVLAVDRAGVVGADGETHQGLFDAAFLSQIPGMTVMCPASFAELRDMLEYAVFEEKGPVAVRYPRGGEGSYKEGGCEREKLLRSGSDVTIVAYGTTVPCALEAAALLEGRGIAAEVIKLGFINPLPLVLAERSVKKTNALIVVEDCAEQGCVGLRLTAALAEDGICAQKVLLKNFGRDFVPQGTQQELFRLYGLDGESVAKEAAELFPEKCSA